MHLVDFIIRIYHDARSPERQIWEYTSTFVLNTEAVHTSETLVPNYQTTRYLYPQDHNMDELSIFFYFSKERKRSLL